MPLLLHREFAKVPDLLAPNDSAAAAAAAAVAATMTTDDQTSDVAVASDFAQDIDDLFAGIDDDALLAMDLDALTESANHDDPAAVRLALKEALTTALVNHGLGCAEEENGIKISNNQKDVFHCLQQLSIGFGTTNSWAPLFLKCVSDVLLVDDPECKSAVLRYLETQHAAQPGVTAEMAKEEASKQYHSFVRKNPQYVHTFLFSSPFLFLVSDFDLPHRYMKKAPMSPEETYAKLKQVERVFAGAQCTKKKGPPRALFNAQACTAWKQLLDLVLDGHHGSVAGTPRYLPLGRCKTTQLQKYSCVANTSWVEAWHNLQRDSATPCASMIFADLMLHLCVDRWNVDAGLKYAGEVNFGVEGVAALYDDSII